MFMQNSHAQHEDVAGARRLTGASKEIGPLAGKEAKNSRCVRDISLIGQFTRVWQESSAGDNKI